MRLRLLLALLLLPGVFARAAEFNVRDHGAKGDGVAVDSPAINAAIAAAAAAVGGTVRLPPGTYLSFSIRLQSNITLQLDRGATLLAATPAPELGTYDPPEPNAWGEKHRYQDFGHSHWHNSLIWGEGLEHIAIIGEGLIHGRGLSRHYSYDTGPAANGPANKTIGLKNCRDVSIRGLSILEAGHFALLANGVDRLTLENLIVDTNRDGLDIDACRQVRISNCRVNSPNDDAIVLKTSFGLGEIRATENVIITHCAVSGFDVGSVLDGTRRRTTLRAPDRDGPTGRIKLGTESNGDFRRITISDCTFERSRGLAIESVDGGMIEDLTVTNLTMREVTNPPIFIRLGARLRGPAGTAVGRIRRVHIRGVTATDADPRYGAILISGLPGNPIEDVTLADIHITARGGLTPEIVARQPADLVNPFFLRGDEPGVTGPRDPLAVPLRTAAYPEPSMFGLIPASALYARHVRNLNLNRVTITYATPDTRPRVVLSDVTGQTDLE